MARFYAIETMREVATKDGDLLFECEYLRIFDTKKERDAYVDTYDKPEEICTVDGAEYSRHVWSARTTNYAEAMKVKRENDAFYK